MEILHGLPAASKRRDCALTIGNFDGVHRGHQAMLAQLVGEARRRGLPACVMTFYPHPRAYFALRQRRAELAPHRIAPLRDKLIELRNCGVDRVVLMRFDVSFASRAPQAFIDDVLDDALRARFVLVGDDFRFGANRTGTYAMLEDAGMRGGFEVARMTSHEMHGLRVSSSAVREALARGNMAGASALLGRPFCISGRVPTRRQDDTLGLPVLNLRFGRALPAAQGTFVVSVSGWGGTALPGIGSLAERPVGDGRTCAMLQVHLLDWPVEQEHGASYRRDVQVQLLHKLHDGHCVGDAHLLRENVARDVREARAWLARANEREGSMPLLPTMR